MTGAGHVLGGHGHLACITDPDLVASIIAEFVSHFSSHRNTACMNSWHW